MGVVFVVIVLVVGIGAFFTGREIGMETMLAIYLKELKDLIERASEITKDGNDESSSLSGE